MEWVLLISQVGVPTTICLIILLRMDKTIAKLSDNIVFLSKIVSHCPNNNYPKVL